MKPFALLLLIGAPLLAERVDLNGDWSFSIHGEFVKKVRVPSTYLPVGGATLERDFTVRAPGRGHRWLLSFDGVLMGAHVRLNGAALGDFGPNTPFTIDVTRHLKAGTNRISVDVDDIDGIQPWARPWITAFPRFGGLARDVYLESKPAVYIDNARLDYRLVSNYQRAECRLTTWVHNTTARAAQVEIRAALDSPAGARTVTAQPGLSSHELTFAVEAVRLWSPDKPSLYTLNVSLGRADMFSALTGFKELKVQGRDFFLNGKKIFLKGIFRHDIHGYNGHTATPKEIERDIADIKSLGCNFLRLGHYPQHKYVIELAAKYGLLTSGEPPVFGMNQQDPKVVEGAKFCLGGLIRRDWNNPSAAVWIISNEVGTDLGYMKEMSAFVRSLDPNRLVSIVDNTRWTAENAPWQKFREARIDFISQNAYGAGLDGYYDKIEKILPDDLPYVISEWGGPLPANLVQKEGSYFLDHSARIAGIWFWEYQDIPMARWSPEGVLHWSIVDMLRRPYESYYALKSLYTGQPAGPARGLTAIPAMDEKLPTTAAQSTGDIVDLANVANSSKVLAELKPANAFAYPEKLPIGRVTVGGLPFVLSKEVVMLSADHSSVRVPVGRAAKTLAFLGHVCFNTAPAAATPGPPDLPFINEAGQEGTVPPRFGAYPLAGKFKEEIGQYVLTYEDGSTEAVPLLNGIHFADYRLFFGFSHIDSIAIKTEQAVKYKADKGAKSYQLRLFTYNPKKQGVKIQSLDFRLTAKNYVPILAALTVQN